MADIDKIEKFQSMLQKDPSNFHARRQLAMLLLDNGYKEEALAHFLYLTETFSDDSELYYNIGIVYEKLKDLNNAEKAYQKAIEFSPNDVDAHYNLGLVYIDKKLYLKAINCFETVLDYDNEDSNTYFNIGICYFKQENFNSAKYYFERTIELNNEDLYAHFYLGNIHKLNGDNLGARVEFEQVLLISPDYSWAYFNLAVLDFEEGDTFSALNNLKETISLNPKDVDAYKIWVKILIKEENFEQAFEIIEIAIGKCGENGDLYFLKGEILKNLNDEVNAKEAYSIALRNFNTLNFNVNMIKERLN